MKKLLSLFLFLFLISLVQANGLSIRNDTFIINKTDGVDYSINIEIKNEEPFNFQNIFDFI